MTTIDVTTFASPHQPGFGFGTGPRNGPWIDTRRDPDGIIIHTTNGNIGSSFRGEAQFLRDMSLTRPPSDRVSAHYLVGKGGQIARIHEDTRITWHTGVSLREWNNLHTIGIENHFTPGEVWTEPQQKALTFLVRHLMRRWNIGRDRIQTHRFIALPAGRKVDPSSLTNAAFEDWRSSLTPLSDAIPSFRVIIGIDFASVREGPRRSFPEALIPDGNGVLHPVRLAPGTVIGIDEEVQGERISGDDRWLHIVKPDAWGFIHRSLVVPV
ncbi:MAG TPA: peptidoglycan recognition family protein [Herpetosiphonaceae bacterium]